MTTNTRKDYFWPLFLLAAGALLLLAAYVGWGFFENRFTEGEFPFRGSYYGPQNHQNDVYFNELPSVYADAATYGWENWSWDATIDMRSSEEVISGERSIAVAFNKEWSGFYLGAPHFDTTPYDSFALSLLAPSGQPTPTLYLEFYDQEGNTIGRQLLSWYAPDYVIRSGLWYALRVPLSNLNIDKRNINGFAIVSSSVGRIYLDDIAFSKESVAHRAWVSPIDPSEIPPEKFSALSLFDFYGTPTPYTSDFFSRGNWRALIGKIDIRNGVMKFIVDEGASNTTLALLRGSEGWKDYEFFVETDWISGDTLDLVGRFKDEINYVSCSFADRGRYLEMSEWRRGGFIPHGHAPELIVSENEGWKNVRLGMRISGDRVSCIQNGEEALWEIIPTMPQSGGVALGAWDRPMYKSRPVIKKVTVSAI